MKKMFILACVVCANLIMSMNGYAYDLLEYYPITPGSSWQYHCTRYDVNSQLIHFWTEKNVTGDYVTFNGVQTVPQAYYDSDYANMTLINDRDFFAYDSNYIYVYGYEQVGDPSWNDDPLGKYTYTPPITLKRNMDVGESWTSSITVTDPNGDSSSFSLTQTLVGVEEIEVPAGKFSNCLKIRETYSDDPGVTEYTWWAKGVGEVKNTESDSDGFEDIMELTSYSGDSIIPNNLAALSGTITYNGSPVCSMVLANGQYQFTCSGDGSFNLDVPLDSNGQITVYSFVSGLAPYKQVIDPSEGQGLQIQMEAGGEGTGMDISYSIDEATSNPSWVRLTGNITYEDTPVCSMALANGQYMFTCSGDGSFDLEVPLDANGAVTLYGFCSGLPPYKEVFSVN